MCTVLSSSVGAHVLASDRCYYDNSTRSRYLHHCQKIVKCNGSVSCSACVGVVQNCDWVARMVNEGMTCLCRIHTSRHLITGGGLYRRLCWPSMLTAWQWVACCTPSLMFKSLVNGCEPSLMPILSLRGVCVYQQDMAYFTTLFINLSNHILCMCDIPGMPACSKVLHTANLTGQGSVQIKLEQIFALSRMCSSVS